MTKWCPIAGYESTYEVSDEGAVRSLDRQEQVSCSGACSCGRSHHLRQRKGTVLVQRPGKYGKMVYLRVNLCQAGRAKTVLVHHPVAEAFLGSRPVGLDICHGMSGQLDNSAENLRYYTCQGNLDDMTRDERQSRGSARPLAKLTEEVVRECRRLNASGVTKTALADRFGVSRAAMRRAINGETWRHVD